MAEEFKYKPEWDGPLPGPSFEKQTEDAINALHRRIDEYIAPIIPFDDTPYGPTTTGSPGTVAEYARGDHQHPAQTVIDKTRALDHMVSMTLTRVSSVSGGNAEPVGTIGEAATDFGGTTFNIDVNIPNAAAPSGGSSGVDGLMTAEDKARLEELNPYPRISGAAVSYTSDMLVGGDSSVALPSDSAVELRFVGAHGVKTDIASASGAVSVSIGIDGGQIAGEGLVSVNDVLAINQGFVATESAAGLMTPADKINLGDAFIGASAYSGGITFTRVNEEVVNVELIGTGGGGGEGGGGAVAVDAVADAGLAFNYSPDAPARLSLAGQPVALSLNGVQYARTDAVLRNGVPFTTDFSTMEFTLSVNAAPTLAGDPPPVLLSASLFGDGLAVPAEGLLSVDEPLEFRGLVLDVTYETPDEEHADGPTNAFGTFDVSWVRTANEDGETPAAYSVSILWHAPEGTPAGSTMALTSIVVNGGSPATAALQDNVALATPFEAPNVADADVVLIVSATPEAIAGMANAVVAGGTGAAFAPISIGTDDIPIGETETMEGLLLYVTYFDPDEEHVNGKTDAFGTFNVAWTRLSEYDFSVSILWNAPDSEEYASAPEAAMTLETVMTDGSTKRDEVLMPDVAGAIAGTSANSEDIAVLKAEQERAIAGQELLVSSGMTNPKSVQPICFAMMPTSSVAAYSAAVAGYYSARTAYMSASSGDAGEDARSSAWEAMYSAVEAATACQTDMLSDRWGRDESDIDSSGGSYAVEPSWLSPFDSVLGENAGAFTFSQEQTPVFSFDMYAAIGTLSGTPKDVVLSGIPNPDEDPLDENDDWLRPPASLGLALWDRISERQQYCRAVVTALPATPEDAPVTVEMSSVVLSGGTHVPGGSNTDGSVFSAVISCTSAGEDGGEYSVGVVWDATPESELTAPDKFATITLKTTLANGETNETTADITDAVRYLFA